MNPSSSPISAREQSLYIAAVTLLNTLQAILDLRPPLTGNPTHAQLIEYWEYEKSQGNGEAETNLHALEVMAAVKALLGLKP